MLPGGRVGNCSPNVRLHISEAAGRLLLPLGTHPWKLGTLARGALLAAPLQRPGQSPATGPGEGPGERLGLGRGVRRVRGRKSQLTCRHFYFLSSESRGRVSCSSTATPWPGRPGRQNVPGASLLFGCVAGSFTMKRRREADQNVPLLRMNNRRAWTPWTPHEAPGGRGTQGAQSPAEPGRGLPPHRPAETPRGQSGVCPWGGCCLRPCEVYQGLSCGQGHCVTHLLSQLSG